MMPRMGVKLAERISQRILGFYRLSVWREAVLQTHVSVGKVFYGKALRVADSDFGWCLGIR
jgi:hypothetical protein